VSAPGAVAASGAPSGTQARAGGTACRTSDLSLQVIQGAEDQSSTGSFYIQLTNVSSGTCTLYGFPGVDLAGSDGASLGIKDVWTVRVLGCDQNLSGSATPPCTRRACSCLPRSAVICSNEPPASFRNQNIPLSFAAVCGTSWITSQCSTTLPSSSRKKSASARPGLSGLPGSRSRWE
jgi:Protein of unknown function (DUF4232)